MVNMIITIVFCIASAITKYVVAHSDDMEEHIKEITE